MGFIASDRDIRIWFAQCTYCKVMLNNITSARNTALKVKAKGSQVSTLHCPHGDHSQDSLTYIPRAVQC